MTTQHIKELKRDQYIKYSVQTKFPEGCQDRKARDEDRRENRPKRNENDSKDEDKSQLVNSANNGGSSIQNFRITNDRTFSYRRIEKTEDNAERLQYPKHQTTQEGNERFLEGQPLSWSWGLG